jgi:hypothetical protein
VRWLSDDPVQNALQYPKRRHLPAHAGNFCRRDTGASAVQKHLEKLRPNEYGGVRNEANQKEHRFHGAALLEYYSDCAEENEKRYGKQCVHFVAQYYKLVNRK